MSTTSPDRAALDTRALVEPVDRAAVRAHHRELRRRARAERARTRSSGPSRVLARVLGTTLLALLLAVGAAVVAAVLALAVVGLVAAGVAVPVAVGLVAAGVVAVGLLVARGVRGSSAREHELAYRLSRFAAANGFDVEPRIDEPARPSGAFDVGILRVARDVVRARGPRAVEVATYTYSAGYRNGEPFAFTYAMVALDRTLPRVVVETVPARGVRGARAPRGVERVWELPVDGPFGDRHHAYGPVRSATGTARAVFTPEIVEALVRGPLPLAAEVSGDRLFLFSERALDLLDPAVWERLLGTATDLAARLSRADGPGGPGGPGAAPGTR
ncbi:hypothetical protein [Cellulosimicrobium protaetiae]|uniref:DUF3137 domain-containing protein n=1 Tax=Cellulosimicrobium protaetiae TaxID=2587808 RepID=A0A6M5UJ97_9MICO|nr:hypothetical protein [Cellulosimicrobium protaetiae]QJW37158.1 hypothetical protein FIC82_014145 [Cellulosimicrobium protaetiae]